MDRCELNSIEILSEKTEKFYQKYLRDAPKSVQELKEAATKRLLESKVEERALKIGQIIPKFILINALSQKELNSQSELQKGPLVISFFRGSWCGYCNIELEALAKINQHIKSLGASLVAISPQIDGGIADVVELYNIDFPILIDDNNATAEAFGLAVEMDSSLHEAYRDKFCINVPQINGTNDWRLPITATYIVGSDGVIIECDTCPDHTKRMEPKRILEVLLDLSDKK
ncbi:MAG: AhpC/TSA family protein [Gammaproteobacteria bacterium]|nr:AhpC/TSA family protein [Gammaproteobacteria bacterium]